MNLSGREQEIIRLREEEHWTFRAIGTQFKISYARASQIYHRAQRKQRDAKRALLLQSENRLRLSFFLTRGEGILLDKILSAVLDGQLNRCLQIESPELDPDYLCAAELHKRLSQLLSGPD